MKKPTVPQEWLNRAPQLGTIAKWINENTTLFAEIEKGYCNTDRQIPGTRLRHPGKGRTGNRIKVFVNEEHRRELVLNPWHYMFSPGSEKEKTRVYPSHPVIDHNSAETYRTNSEVVEKLQRYLGENPKARKK